ncbi:MAG TPA: hypothetical protein VE135_19475 [Pyrinomonadaceae bacterium]|nr:hypothetical protein [Pyrinomonadaceae bacterium]
MKECLSEEILQRYFDGELESERMEGAALHLAGCQTCAASLRELEGEAELLYSALAPEFDAVVPTERLQRRIDAAIAGLQVVGPVASQASTSGWRNWLESLSSLVSLTPQRTFGYAGLAVVLAFAAIFGISRLRNTPPVTPPSQVAAGPQRNPSPLPAVVESNPADSRVALTRNPTPQRSRRTSRATTARPLPSTPAVAEVKLLPGERSYLKTIAALDSTIKSGKKTMRPSLQAEYERNLALVDRAIATTRSAAKRNPNDPDAADFMFSAYQSKVDLLNTIADARVYNRQR